MAVHIDTGVVANGGRSARTKASVLFEQVLDVHGRFFIADPGMTFMRKP
jgi:hypothetical protein